ncbi:DNA internalization-related competence protein ComEC/Rec2 [Planococcus lenghuensis]|uniref:DNA internalization-related competence protein ComEC/Rec2 n=1 Tax=Planococcus lenghuensis TaxID=2213202 RepID=A0A1Q2KXM8_9BACL|nr:DNA internalization-related competence protein ComEC/Rec2 [Planococcus lenghuensis]AQQ52950.1 DNA internalization-related competence protein ComEC/Rec2 [Planococcus lenghuensis]
MLTAAAGTAAATYAAHESPGFLVFLVPLFVWLYWKGSSGWIPPLLLVFLVVYAVQLDRLPEEMNYGAPFEGRLVFEGGAVIDGDSMRGLARIQDGPAVYATYRLNSAAEKAFYEDRLCCSVLSVSGTFSVPDPPPHRFAFDMPAYLKHNGAARVLELSGVREVEERRDAAGLLARKRQEVALHIDRAFPDSLESEAQALLIGERAGMSQEEEQLFRTLGISHLYAISGLHIAIMTGITYFLLIRLHVRKETAWLLLAIALPLYAFLAGGSPSVIRAVSMAELVLILRLVGTRISVMPVLLASFITFILVDPYIIYQIGFQLSYGAVFGLLCSGQLLGQLPKWQAAFAITAVSQLGLYPLLLVHFYEVSLSAFVVNFLFVPLYSIVIVPANFLLLGLTLLTQPAADVLFTVYEPMRAAVGSFMAMLASLPYQMWNPGKPEAGWLIVLFGSVLLFFVSIERGYRHWKLLFIFVPALVFTAIPYLDPSLRVSFIDVGQGDSALIELPHRQGVYLVDTGGVVRFGGEEFQERHEPYEVGRRVVAPYLKGKGISGIDALILSHADADHIEGAEEILSLFRVGQLHVSPGSLEAPGMDVILAEAGAADVLAMGDGVRWSAGSASFSYLAPADADYAGNDDSLVLLLEQGAFRVLFTGDIEEDGERKVTLQHGDRLRGVTVLKIAHHGSQTSSTAAFLEAAVPAFAIISSGKDNRYGHPHPDVVARLETLGIPMFNTADSGTIELMVRDGSVRKTTVSKENAGPP